MAAPVLSSELVCDRVLDEQDGKRSATFIDVTNGGAPIVAWGSPTLVGTKESLAVVAGGKYQLNLVDLAPSP